MRAYAKTKRVGGKAGSVIIPHLRAASHYATDRTISDVQTASRARIRSVGLGGLANAVASTSSLKKRRTSGVQTAWGVIYARGGQYSRANQALMSYTEGALITPSQGKKWLAYPTKAAGRLVRLPIPRVGGRPGFANFKNQPSRFKGMELEFVRFSSRRAALVIRDGVVNNRTGRAKPRGKRVSRATTPKKFIVIFWLIPFTRRAKRFDQHALVKFGASAGIPRYIEEYQSKFPLR